MDQQMEPATQELFSRILALHDEGLNANAIATELDIQFSQVRKVLAAFGEESKTPPKDLVRMQSNIMSPEVWERRFQALADQAASVAEKSLAKAEEILDEPEVDVSNYEPKLASEMLKNQTARLRAVKDLSLAGAVSIDKAALLTGRATQKIEIDVHSADFREAEKIYANLARLNSLQDGAIDVKEIPPAE